MALTPEDKQYLETTFATKHDLERGLGSLRRYVDSGLGSLRNDTEGRFGSLREDMESRFASLRGEMGSGFGSLMSEMQSRSDSLRDEIQQLDQKTEMYHQRSNEHHLETRMMIRRLTDSYDYLRRRPSF